jgi:phage shock protein PspC (stress-responsive transcriptional regulator)
MDRDVLRATADDDGILPVGGGCETTGKAMARRLAWEAWLVRAAAVTFLVGGGVVSYLFLSAV